MIKTVFINGKQKRVRCDEYISADPLLLHQMEMWEYIPVDEDEEWPVMDINSGRVERRRKGDV